MYSEIISKKYKFNTFDNFSDKSIDKAKQCLVDYIGCLYAGFEYESSNIARKYSIENYAPGRCTIAGVKEKLVPIGACFVNAVTAHATELDDVAKESKLHVGVIVIPVALALGEQLNKSGFEVLSSIIAGYDFTFKLGRAANTEILFNRGFHPTTVCGVFGATITAAHLMQLSAKETINALGIAGSFSSGNLECYSDGSLTKRLQVGVSASSGIKAAELSSLGFTGPSSIFEGSRGFFHAYSENCSPKKLITNGSNKEIENICFKRHACCGFIQPSIDAVLDIKSKHRNFDIHMVESITVELSKLAFNIVGQPKESKYNPQSVVDCQFSSPFCVALACIKNRASLGEFTEKIMKDKNVQNLMTKIIVKPNSTYDTMVPAPSKVIIKLKTGEQYSKEILYAKGDPKNPMNWDEVTYKFNEIVPYKLLSRNAQHKIIEIVKKFETLDNVNNLTKFL